MDKEREEKIKELLKLARELKGTPYERGAKPRTTEEFMKMNGSKPKVVDCSSYAAFLFWKVGVKLMSSTITQAINGGIKIFSFKRAKPGDLLFFEGEKGYYDFEKLPGKYIGHVALLSDTGTIIHAINSGGKSGVIENRFIKEEHPLYHPESIVLIKRFIY